MLRIRVPAQLDPAVGICLRTCTAKLHRVSSPADWASFVPQVLVGTLFDSIQQAYAFVTLLSGIHPLHDQNANQLANFIIEITAAG